jgi:predicted phage baseplate assembly protein
VAVTLPAPNLDDRSFQDLVDEAKLMVQRRWPEWTGWTDHNVSDPGVTLIETFAFMVEQLIFRLNRVPDKNYVKFLELIGIELQPPHAARADVTFWLTAPQEGIVAIPVGSEVATERTDTTEAVVFRTTEHLDIVPCYRSAAASARGGAGQEDQTDSLAIGREIGLFSEPPQPGDAFYVGLSNPTPSCIVAVRFTGDVEGYGIKPSNPPRRWEAWTASGWQECEIERDDTGGFNQAGDVLLHVPRSHAQSTVAGRSGGWLRCVVTTPEPGQLTYRATPKIQGLRAFTVGGTTGASHAEEIRNEILGISEGVPGQWFDLEHRPVTFGSEPEHVQVMTEIAQPDGTVDRHVELWHRVDSFATTGPQETVFRIDPSAGRVEFPPAVRNPDGSVDQRGAVPPLGSVLRIASYSYGGGRAGNVSTRTLVVVKSSVPSVARCENRRAADGGVDGETLEAAKRRAPLALRSRDRAVTAEDFEYHTRQAAREIARAHCEVRPDDPGLVRVLVVPHVPEDPQQTARFALEHLRPREETLALVRANLDQRRLVGTRVVIEPPLYQGVTVLARLRSWRTADVRVVQANATTAVYRYLHPVLGGPYGDGWPFGRPLTTGEIHAALAGVPGVDFVEDVLLFGVDLATNQRAGQPSTRVELVGGALFYSLGHQIRVEGGP